MTQIRRAYDAIEEPSEETVAAAREVLLAEIESMKSPRSSSRPGRGWVIVVVAAAILVATLLVTPAFGIGGRLLDLVESTPANSKIAFISRHSRLGVRRSAVAARST